VFKYYHNVFSHSILVYFSLPKEARLNGPLNTSLL